MAGLLLTAAHGELSGWVLVDEREAGSVAGQTGLLLQDPRAGLVAETVGRDIAFGLENQCLARTEIWRRVREALETSAFPYDVSHATSALSGGETQRLALAGSLVLASSVLLLDEPTSMLDPESAATVRAAVQDIASRRGTTTVIVEHQLEPWLDFADRLIVLGTDGTVVADGSPRAVLDAEGATLAELGVWVPGSGVPELSGIDADLVAPWRPETGWLVRTREVSVSLRGGLVERRTPPTVALDGVDAELTAGRALAVTGVSGAGKSTLVSVLAGLLRPTRGDVTAAPGLAVGRRRAPWQWKARDLVERLSWVPQVSEHAVVAASVLDEVMASGRACGRDEPGLRRRAESLLEAFGLSARADASPYHLSGGEQRRLMVAAALAHGPRGVLLDEPTVGQDRLTWSAVLGAVAAARDAGSGVAIASHDSAAAAALADESLHLVGGSVAA